MVARRFIARGEQLTMDYATFCADFMHSFECQCGSPDCRGIIRGTDYAARFVERYGDHVSDYVRTKRQQLAGQANDYQRTIELNQHFPVIGD